MKTPITDRRLVFGEMGIVDLDRFLLGDLVLWYLRSTHSIHESAWVLGKEKRSKHGDGGNVLQPSEFLGHTSTTPEPNTLFQMKTPATCWRFYYC